MTIEDFRNTQFAAGSRPCVRTLLSAIKNGKFPFAVVLIGGTKYIDTSMQMVSETISPSFEKKDPTTKNKNILELLRKTNGS